MALRILTEVISMVSGSGFCAKGDVHSRCKDDNIPEMYVQDIFTTTGHAGLCDGGFEGREAGEDAASGTGWHGEI